MKILTIILTSVFLVAYSSCNTNCSIHDFNIKGEWDVYKVEFIDENNKLKKILEAQGKNFDEFVEESKLFEEVEFNFKEEGVLEVNNPDKLGGSGETTYSYSNGSDELTFGGRKYGFKVKTCNKISIIDFAFGESCKMIMYCKRK